MKPSSTSSGAGDPSACSSWRSPWMAGSPRREAIPSGSPARRRGGTCTVTVFSMTPFWWESRRSLRTIRRWTCGGGQGSGSARSFWTLGCGPPVKSRLFLSGDPVWIFHSCPCPPGSPLADRARLVRVPQEGPFLSWPAVLESLGGDSVISLIVEGGGRVAGSSLQAGVIQRIHFYYGPKILGSAGLPGVGELQVNRLADALAVSSLKVRRLGGDFLLDGYLAPS